MGRPQDGQAINTYPVDQPPYTYREIASLVNAYNRSGQPDEVIIAQIWSETRFDPIRSPDGRARGLMQVTPIAVKEVNRVYGSRFNHASMMNPATNIIVGTLYLGIEANRTGSLRGGLTNYNNSSRYADIVLRAAEGLRRPGARPMEVLTEVIGR